MKHTIDSTYCTGKKNIFRVYKNDSINFSLFNGEVRAKNSFLEKKIFPFRYFQIFIFRYFQILRAKLFTLQEEFCKYVLFKSEQNFVKIVLKVSFFGIIKLQFNPSLTGIPLLLLLKRLGGLMLEISENHS